MKSKIPPRCPDCCPTCKHQCIRGGRPDGRHAGFLHECSKHYWGSKQGRGRTLTHFPEDVADDHAREVDLKGYLS